MSFFEKIKAGLKKTKENTAANINAVFATFRTVDAALKKELAALDKLKGPALAQQRYQMFRAMGQGLPPAGKEEP